MALILRHFQIITPENCMKPQSIHPAEDTWNFEDTDRFVDFARANDLEVVGHCLVWAKDDRTDEWMMREDGKPVSRETLLRRIETHIDTVVGRYADAVTMWDVVNEAIGDGEEGLLRDSVYSRTTGIDFIVTAFKAARAKDPDAPADLQRLQRPQAGQAREADRAADPAEAGGSARGRLRDAGPLRAG